MAFKIDLHTHTFFSGDGVSSPEDNIAAARAKGLHGFAITDHNTCDAVTYLLDKGLMREDGLPVDDFLIIPGQEVTTAEGHLLCIGTTMPEFERHARARSLRDHSRARRPCHSATPLRFVPGRIRFPVLETLPIDALEVFNAATTLRRYNTFAFEYAQVRGLPMTAASDAHHSAALGTAYTILNTDDFSVKESCANLQEQRAQPALLSPRDSVRKTWNNWMRLRRRKKLPIEEAKFEHLDH